VAASHKLSHDVSDAIEKRFSGASVTIHVEPCDGSCPADCLAGCLLDTRQREAMREAPVT